MMQQSSTFQRPHEPFAIRKCKFYIYQDLQMNTTSIRDAARLEDSLRRAGSLPPTASIHDPNLVLTGGINKYNNHHFLLHALLSHP